MLKRTEDCLHWWNVWTHAVLIRVPCLIVVKVWSQGHFFSAWRETQGDWGTGLIEVFSIRKMYQILVDLEAQVISNMKSKLLFTYLSESPIPRPLISKQQCILRAKFNQSMLPWNTLVHNLNVTFFPSANRDLSLLVSAFYNVHKFLAKVLRIWVSSFTDEHPWAFPIIYESVQYWVKIAILVEKQLIFLLADPTDEIRAFYMSYLHIIVNLLQNLRVFENLCLKTVQVHVSKLPIALAGVDHNIIVLSCFFLIAWWGLPIDTELLAYAAVVCWFLWTALLLLLQNHHVTLIVQEVYQFKPDSPKLYHISSR